MCGPGWLHAYTSPLLAVLLNPVHADFKDPRLFEAEGEVEKTDRGLKIGCRELKCVNEIALPVITNGQKVRFAILCSLEVYDCPKYVKWSNSWLSGADRSAKSARSALRSVASASRASSAAWSVTAWEDSSVCAALAAEEADRSAKSVAIWADSSVWPVPAADEAAASALSVARSVAAVAASAAAASRAARSRSVAIDFISLAQRAVAL